MAPGASTVRRREHDSMRLTSGSVVFSVHGTLFKVPKALLEQKNTSAFADMIKLSKFRDELTPIVLDDSSSAFAAFVAALMDPYNSCLGIAPQSSHDVKKLLLLAVFSHKYCVTALERRAVSLLMDTVTSETIRSFLGPHIPDTGKPLHARIDASATAMLPPAQALELALRLRCEHLTGLLDSVIKEDVWKGRMEPYDGICLAHNIGDPSLMGAACYMLMIKHPDVTSLPNMPRLSLKQRAAIERERLACYRKWDRISAELSEGGPLKRTQLGRSWRHHKGSFEPALGPSWKQFATDNVPSFDVRRRIRITRIIASLYFSCSSRLHGDTCMSCKWEVEDYFTQLESDFEHELGIRFLS